MSSRILSLSGRRWKMYCLPLAIFLMSTSLQAQQPDQIEFFESHIRPVLVEHCYSCHNSVGEAEGGVVLDHRAGVLQTIDLQQPEQSRLLQVVRHEIADKEMPSGGVKLPPKVISDLARWIKMGAPDPRDTPPDEEQLADEQSWESTLARRKEWWCFQSLSKQALPDATNWSDHPVDRYIAAQLRTRQLQPAPDASRETLLRRLSYVLTGLPPTDQQMKRFLAPGSQLTFEQLVDEMLDSPLFGERWARHWMDWLRYAESHGSEGDPEIPHAYRYRDYLIRAINADVPYDQMVREHIAGDLLAQPRINNDIGINESAIATAHWRMVFHGFAPTDALDEKVRFTDDQINVFSKAFLGLTISCARCHNHKFDAISQADYYALFGILGSTRPSMQDVNSPAQQHLHQAELRDQKQKLRELIAQMWIEYCDQGLQQLPEIPAPWKKALQADSKNSGLLDPWKQMRKQDSSWDERWRGLVQSWKSHQRIQLTNKNAALQAWSYADGLEDWIQRGNGLTGRTRSPGEFVVTSDGQCVVERILPSGVYSHLLSTRHRGIFSSPAVRLEGDWDLWVRICGDRGAMLRYAVQHYPRDGTVYPTKKLKDGKWRWLQFPMRYWEGDLIHVEVTTAGDSPVLGSEKTGSWFGVREARLVPADTNAPREWPEYWQPLFVDNAHQPESNDQLGAWYLQTLRQAAVQWGQGAATDAQAELLNAALQLELLPNKSRGNATLAEMLDRYRRLAEQVPLPTRVVGLMETTGTDQALFHRGDHKSPGDPVPRRFLEVFQGTPIQSKDSGRLQLAEAVMASNNSLPARVIVNRLWHHLFGRGLVATPDNFGRLGSPPTHPKLLDFLAERISQNWSIKDMIRFLVTSRTWQQSSIPTTSVSEIDPTNQFWSHSQVRRLEAEAIRDAMLQISGRLDTGVFGASIDGGTPRRSVYVRVRRNALDPFLRVFDFPEPSGATGSRAQTNVPAQSLALMNDPFVRGLAGNWAERLLRELPAASEQDRIESMYRAAFARNPSAPERLAAQRYLATLRKDNRELRSQRMEILRRKERLTQSNAALLEPIRQRLLKERAKGQQVSSSAGQPVARWDFSKGLQDQIGRADAVLRGTARIDSGALVLDGKQAYAETKPLNVSLREKTLMAWVQLDGAEQRGGGVVSVQTPDGKLFDAIVFAEKDPRQWMAGSNFFARTESFGGEPETEATSQPVPIAIVYDADGRITGYRGGHPYGQSYRKDSVQPFTADDCLVTFGVRHLPASAGRMFQGRLLRAAVYDRALSAEEVRAVHAGVDFVSHQQLVSALKPVQLKAYRENLLELEKYEVRLRELRKLPAENEERVIWADLALAIFSMKEFIYLK